MSSRRNAVAVLILLAVAGLAGAACGGGGGTSVAGTPAGAMPPEAGSRDGGGSSFDLGPGLGGNVDLTAVGPMIIKTASISVEVARGVFDQRMQDATMVAARHGGFVTSSRTSGETHPTGTIVVRVPASQFEAALGELKALGKVTAEQIAGQDVTAQFVDLQARLRNWEAQQAVLLDLMAKSTSITDSLKVQQALQDVQLAIEEIKGQLRVIGDQTDLATITLSMAEPAGPAAPRDPGPFVRAWRAAVDGTVAVFTAVIVGLGYLVPVFLIALAAGLVWLVVRRVRTKTAPTV